jgi:hypothetical protein
MRAQAYTSTGLWQRTKWISWAYVAGLLSGVLVGWLLHGIISLFIRFGLVALLLLPLIVILYLFWRSSRGNRRTTVMTWSGGNGFDSNGGPSTNGGGRINPDANGVYDLDALLREQERQR